jgi:hypothetical protein
MEMTASETPRPGVAAELRASHADRDRVVEILRIAAGDGRLTSAELDERLEAALSARTYRELAVLTADLPADPVPPSVKLPQAKDLVRISQRFGDAVRTGNWMVPRRMEIRLMFGDLKLDFTEAVVTHDTLHLSVELRAGGDLTLVTRPGIVVDAGDLTVSRGNIKVRQGNAPDVPVILRVMLTGRVRGGNVVARLPRRTLGQWLRRDPGPHRSPAR